MTLKDIRDKLLEIDSNVVYGGVSDPGGDTLWDYIVFKRQKTRRKQDKSGYSDYITVAVVRENFIPETIINDVIAKLETIKGLHVTEDDILYDYTVKPSTGAVVEVAVITFVRPRKA